MLASCKAIVTPINRLAIRPIFVTSSEVFGSEASIEAADIIGVVPRERRR